MADFIMADSLVSVVQITMFWFFSKFGLKISAYAWRVHSFSAINSFFYPVYSHFQQYFNGIHRTYQYCITAKAQQLGFSMTSPWHSKGSKLMDPSLKVNLIASDVAGRVEKAPTSSF